MPAQWTLTHPPTPSPLPASMLSDIISTSLRLYGWTDGGMDVPIMYIYAFCDACVYCVRACIHMFTQYVHVCWYLHESQMYVSYNYGKSPFWMGKSTINGHFLCRFFYVYQGTSYLLPICSWASQVFHAALPREDLHLGHAAQRRYLGVGFGVSVSVHTENASESASW
jgi:hypothetical protein